jgi:hypothetical protein
MRCALLAAALLLAAPGVAAQQAEVGSEPGTRSGTTQDLTLAIGETVRYGHLEVTAEACRVPEDDPEADAFALLRIRDIREERPRFTGWMFASSPALSALDHPRYDVWVLSCSSR